MTITVGGANEPRPERVFVIQRAVVGTSSKVLSRIFCKPSLHNTHDMPEESASDFNLYVNWLHSGILATKNPDNSHFDCDSHDSSWIEQRSEYTQLSRLYLLSKRLKDGAFADAVIDAPLGSLREHEKVDDEINEFPGATCISYIWENIYNDGDKLKRLLVQTFATEENNKNELQSSSMQDFPKQFKEDLLMEVLDRRGKPRSRITEVDNCEFHTHSAEETCVAGRARKCKWDEIE